MGHGVKPAVPTPEKINKGKTEDKMNYKEITYKDIKKNEAINTYIKKADESLKAMGYTEHSYEHVTLVAEKAGYILETLGYDARTVELVKIAGYLHDIGNLVNRDDHSQSGAISPNSASRLRR